MDNIINMLSKIMTRVKSLSAEDLREIDAVVGLLDLTVGRIQNEQKKSNREIEWQTNAGTSQEQLPESSTEVMIYMASKLAASGNFSLAEDLWNIYEKKNNEGETGSQPNAGISSEQLPKPSTKVITPYAQDPRVPASEVCDILWGLKLTYSGTRRGEAEIFLQKVKDLRDRNLVTDEELLTYLPFFLTGTAREWYLRHPTHWQTWETLEEKWLARFRDRKFQRVLTNKIMKRVQGEQEPVTEYLNSLHVLFQKLNPPWSLQEKLNRAYDNMLPYLRNTMRHVKLIHNFDVFELEAAAIEDDFEFTSQC